MKTDTKEKILAVGADIVLEKGFNYTGIQEILKEASVPKGSFYFYFESKEAFGIELIDFYNRPIAERMSAYVNEKGTSSALERLKLWFEWTFECLTEKDFKGGCPIGNLSLEMAGINERFRIKLNETIKEMKRFIGALLENAKKEKELASNADIQALSDFLFSSWEGTIMLMKVTKSTAPKDTFFDVIFNRVLNTNCDKEKTNYA